MLMRLQRFGCVILILLLAACAPEEGRSAEEWAGIALEALQDSTELHYAGQWEGSRGGELVYRNEPMQAADAENVWQPVVPPYEIADMIESASYRSGERNADYAVVELAMERTAYTEAMRARMLEQFDKLAELGEEGQEYRTEIAGERELIEELWKQVEVDAIYTMWIHRDSGVPEQVEVEARLDYTSDGKNMQETIVSRYALQPNGTRLVPEEAAE